MSDTIQDIFDFLSAFIFDLFDWFLGFFRDIFTGQTIIRFGRAVLGVFIDGSFDFTLKSLFELLFGVAFIFFALKTIINIIRG